MTIEQEKELVESLRRIANVQAKISEDLSVIRIGAGAMGSSLAKLVELIAQEKGAN